MSISDKTFDEIAAHLTEGGWKEEGKDGLVTLYSKMIDNKECIKSVAEVNNCRPDQFIKLIIDCELRKKMAENLVQVYPIESGEDHDIIYQEASAPSRFVSNRDFIVARRWKTLEDGTVTMVMKSVEHEKFPPKSNPVRAEVVRQAVSLKPMDNNKTYFIQINSMDMNGMLPSSVISYSMKKMPVDLINKVEKYFNK
jgi:hypothetical protein